MFCLLITKKMLLHASQHIMEQNSLGHNTNVNMFTVNSTKPQFIWRRTVASVIGCNGVSLVHSSTSQWCQCNISWPMWHVININAVPILLWQAFVHCLLVVEMHTPDTDCLIILDTDVSTIIGHDTVVSSQHRSTWTFWSTSTTITTSSYTTLSNRTFNTNISCSVIFTSSQLHLMPQTDVSNTDTDTDRYNIYWMVNKCNVYFCTAKINAQVKYTQQPKMTRHRWHIMYKTRCTWHGISWQWMTELTSLIGQCLLWITQTTQNVSIKILNLCETVWTRTVVQHHHFYFLQVSATTFTQSDMSSM